MKKISRRSFMKSSVLAGAAAAMAGATAVTASAASPAEMGEGNCLNLFNWGEENPIEMVNIELAPGRLIGYEDNGLYSFRGIPYATAKRFESPVPVTSYPNGWQLALSYGTVSPQERCMNGTGAINACEFVTPSNGTSDMVANENCQNLNVWTTSLTSKKPVVVFFHGGGLSSGASNELSYYAGDYFAQREDAVFVSVNHRLNVLGYLDMSQYGDQYASSANAGIEDCVVALRWVHDNIDKFGGDPSNVTIVGQSGGGVKVTTLACMEDTADLFDKVFVMSGGYSNLSKEDGLANTQKLVNYLGLAEDEVAEKLTTMSYEDLYNAAKAAGCSWNTYYGNGSFKQPFIDKNGIMNPNAARRKWLIGTTYSEMVANGPYLIYTQDMSYYLPGITEEDAVRRLTEMYGERADEVIDGFKKAYPDHQLGEALFLNNSPEGGLARWGLINPENGILHVLNRNGVPSYNYVVAYKYPYFGGSIMSHTTDVPFWFASLDTVPYQIKGDAKNARNVSDQMADALAAFAATGDPSTKNLAWKPFTTYEHYTMVFDTKSELKDEFDLELYKAMMNA